MPTEPMITLLSYQHRKRFFWLLVVIFVLALPVAIFYTTGYRVSYKGDTAVIMTTGGLYVNTDSSRVELRVNEVPVTNARLFRSAYYIQNIEAGLHLVVAQQPGYHTWVKRVPVDPYLVTEATAFNVPLVPQVRLVTEFQTATGTAVVKPSQVMWLAGVSSTPPYVISTSTETSAFVRNQEYDLLVALFASSSMATTSPRRSLLLTPPEPERFRFATSGMLVRVSTSTPFTVTKNDLRLAIRDGEVYATWIGDTSRIPQYFCIASGTATTTSLRYGEHVYEQIRILSASSTPPWSPDATKLCRPEIKLDRKQQPVYAIDFVPDRGDLVVMLLDEGITVSEIDDWSWQNTQRLYTGAEPRLIVDNGRLYVYDQTMYFELLTTLINP